MARQRITDMQSEVKKQEVKTTKALPEHQNVDNPVGNVDNLTNYSVRLTTMAEDYYEVSETLKPLEEQKKDLSSRIKDLMISNSISLFNTPKVTATIRETVKSSFIEELLIDTIKKLGVEGIIKTREYVDMSALESAIYKGAINGADLAQCQTETLTRSLYVTKLKIKKQEEE